MKKRLLYVLLGLAVCGLAAWFYIHQPVTLDKQPVIIGHGGMGVGSTLPLNSLGSVEKALSFPISGTELDIRMTADEVLIAFHDNDLTHVTDCSGLVSELNLIDLKDCANSTWLQAEPIRQLDQILSKGWPKGTIFSLDLKSDADIETERARTFEANIAEAIADYPEFKFYLESPNARLLHNMKELGAKADLFLLAQDGSGDANLALVNELTGISINMELISQDELAVAQDLGLQVMIWGTGSVFSNKDALAMKAAIIQTDDIPSMVRLLGLE